MKNAVLLGSLLALAGAGAFAAAQTPVPDGHPSLQGEWTYNVSASTKAPDLSQPPARRGNPPDGGFPGGRGRGMGRRGGGLDVPPSGGSDSAGRAVSPRMADVLRDLQTPPTRMTIVQTDDALIITTADGRTSRLSPNGKKVRDETSGVERTTTWDGVKLVDLLGGLPGGDVQQVYMLDDQAQRRLHVLTTLPNRQDPKNPTVLDRVYDATN